MATYSGTKEFEGATFVQTNFKGATLRFSDVSGVTMRSVDVDGLDINSHDLSFGSLFVNGVAVVPLVEAELNRQFPGRELRNARTPEGLREGWGAVQSAWQTTVAGTPPDLVGAHVEDEWSLAQTLRHLILATGVQAGEPTTFATARIAATRRLPDRIGLALWPRHSRRKYALLYPANAVADRALATPGLWRAWLICKWILAYSASVADIYRALDDQTRRLVLDELAASDGKTLFEICSLLAMHHGLGLTRQGISQHLAVLESAGLITTERRGRSKFHYFNPEPLSEITRRWPPSKGRKS